MSMTLTWTESLDSVILSSIYHGAVANKWWHLWDFISQQAVDTDRRAGPQFWELFSSTLEVIPAAPDSDFNWLPVIRWTFKQPKDPVHQKLLVSDNSFQWPFVIAEVNPLVSISLYTLFLSLSGNQNLLCFNHLEHIEQNLLGIKTGGSYM